MAETEIQGGDLVFRNEEKMQAGESGERLVSKSRISL